MQKWKPIETVPKDGTFVLLYTPHGVIEGYFDGYEWKQEICCCTSEEDVRILSTPTHWQHLPPFPES